ncbi:acyltransferase family protein [Methanosarcina sp. Mfa9]|uniref:acyltransferase family protein n=1 Tax=Methanosarcina sp. Mfa9 TaxID=3439063 RepID=UPI003F834CB4
MKNEKILELDILKTFAIVFIVLCHMDNYVVNFSVFGLIDSYLALAGLSLFFFVSGFAMYHNNHAIYTKRDIFRFYQKRIYRIYPLYWMALIVHVVVFELLKINPGNTSPYNIDFINFFVHMIGFQVFFPSYHIQSMWFIGTILLCYFLYPVIIYYSKNSCSILITAIFLIIPFAVLKLCCNLMTTDFFVYYSIFIWGVLSRKINLFDTLWNNKQMFLEAGFLTSIFLYVFCNLKLICSNDTWIISFVLQNTFQLLFPIVSYMFVKSLSFLQDERIISPFSSIAYASYSVYLFHHPFLSTLKMILTSLSITGLFADFSLFFIGLPILCLLGYTITLGYSKINAHIPKYWLCRNSQFK